MTKVHRKLAILLALVVLGIAGFQAYGGFQRDPRDVTFAVEVKAGGRVTHVNWRADRAGQGSPSFAGNNWQHDVTLPEPGTYTLHLTAVVEPIKATDSHGDTFYRGASATCKIISHDGTASNVGPNLIGQGCSVTKVLVVPDQ